MTTPAADTTVIVSAQGAPSAQTFYAPDTGAVNALAVAVSTPFTACPVGLFVAVKVAVTNTGAATLAINGLAAIPILKNGAAVAAGALIAGAVVLLVTDGTSAHVI